MRYQVLRSKPVMLLGALALSGSLLAAPIGLAVATTSAGAAPTHQAGPPHQGTAVAAPVFTPAVTFVGKVNLSAISSGLRRTAVRTSRQGQAVSPQGSRYRIVDQALARHRSLPSSKPPAPSPTPVTHTNVANEFGFDGLGEIQQAQTKGGLQLEPPDQGLCVGGGYVVEFINNALAAFDPHGDELLAPIGSPQVFAQPTTDFFSDPRCYYDSDTNRWFLQEFIVGSADGSSPSTQFIAVSESRDPTGVYDVYAFDTTDKGQPNCPCFGDYDEMGADANGIYITTDEFGISHGYNGVIVYAVSKQGLETAGISGIPPVVFGYRLTKDAFGLPYIIAPASYPQGAHAAPDTEYFVESSGGNRGDHLLVYALHDTSLLAQPAPPTFYRAEVGVEEYSVPPDAVQKPGPIPLGRSAEDPEGQLQADFDSEMEPTYLDGHLYGELTTGTAGGVDATAWFILTPTLGKTNLTVTLAHQGYVSVKGASLLYPYTAIDKNGNGYLLFSLSGKSYYPSPAYISYGSSGPTGPVRIATSGADPEDGFTCYAAFVGPYYGGCRWGDYSMGVASGGRIYMATEMVPPGFRDSLSNFGTYIWSAPPAAG